jgi:hypothetical protein
MSTPFDQVTSGNYAYTAQDTISVLHETRGARLAKRVTTRGVEPAETGWKFDVEQLAIAGLDALKALLLVLLVKTSTIIIRGALIDPTRPRGVRRLLHDGVTVGARLLASARNRDAGS